MKKLWGSRFQEELAPDAREYSFSLAVDGELLEADVRVSKAHVAGLAKAKLLTKTEAAKLTRGLDGVLAELRRADLSKLASTFEDVHTLIQAVLEKKAGTLAKKLHTGRSRNDLVATSTRLYLKERLGLLDEKIRDAQKALVQTAEKHAAVVIPAYTHLQRAQPVLLAHHLLAYAEMLERDAQRFQQARERMDECPLGSGACAGSSLALDRAHVARLLGFKRVSANSLDAVSDRDFILDVLGAVAVLFVHLSRLSEDLILWNTTEFGFVAFSDSYATGSSLMPQKKNPDMLELTRGRAGRAVGNLTAFLVTLKGLPLAYNRDMQEDKRPVFESMRLAEEALGVVANVIRRMKVHEGRCLEAASDSFLYATDLVEYLILKGMAFQDAHEMVGKMVSHALTVERQLKEFSFKEFRRFSTLIERDIYEVFHPKKSLYRKKTLGSTNPDLVRKQIKLWQGRLRA